MSTGNHPIAAAKPSFHVLGLTTRERPGESGTLETKSYRRRQPHQKSKGGCLTCKAKRVKCDELRPSCRRCSRNKMRCVYETLGLHDHNEFVPFVSYPSFSDPFFIGPPTSLQSRLVLPTVSGADATMLLHYFHSVRERLILPGPINAGSIIPLALEKPHLLHAILAVSASHLRSYKTHSPISWQVEHFQQALSAQKLQIALQEPLDQASSDALLLCAMLLNLLAFTVPEDSGDKRPWVFNHGSEGLGWFRLQLGLRTLLCITRRFHGPESVLRSMFEASRDEGLWQRDDHGSMPAHWLHLYDMESPSETLCSTYKESLQALAALRRLEPVSQNFALHLKVFGNFDIDFYYALVGRDPTALWILGYWLGLLCRYDIWWIKGMALRDYTSIMERLHQEGLASAPGNSGLIWKQLLKDLGSASE